MQKAIRVGAILGAAIGAWWFIGGSEPADVGNRAENAGASSPSSSGSSAPATGQAARGNSADGASGPEEMAGGASDLSGESEAGFVFPGASGAFPETTSHRTGEDGSRSRPRAGTATPPRSVTRVAPGPGVQDSSDSNRSGPRNASADAAEGAPVTAPPTNQELVEEAFGERRTRPSNPDPRDNLLDEQTADYYARRSLGENPSEADLNERRGWARTVGSGESDSTRKRIRDRARQGSEDGS